jgi:hypothetical protein
MRSKGLLWSGACHLYPTLFSPIKIISSSFEITPDRECRTIAAVPTRRSVYISRTILTTVLHRTVPTKDQILVPETLLKKRKSQEKAREQRLSAIEKRKKVSRIAHPYTKKHSVMIPTNKVTRPSGQCCPFVNHLSGLSNISHIGSTQLGT